MHRFEAGRRLQSHARNGPIAWPRAALLAQRPDTLGTMPRAPRYSDFQLRAAVAASPNLHRVLMALGVSPGGGNYECIRSRMAALGLDAPHLERRSTRGLHALDDEILGAVAGSRSFAQVLARLGQPPGGRAQSALTRRVRDLGVDTSHFSGRAWRHGSRTPVVSAVPLDEVLVEGRFTATATLKRRLIAAGIKAAECEVCGGQRWNGAPMPLELDHLNGRRDDNRLDNLRLLCPNCHAQTSTYRGRNIGKPWRYALAARVPER